ncbi:putative ribonuclease H-like domain-containing protein [Tanacetum coccineum]
MVPRAVLMKSGLVSVNTARQVNAAHSKTTVNAARPKLKVVVNAARPKAAVIAVQGNNVNAVKASAYYEEIDRGYVAFGGNTKGGKITRKCTIKLNSVLFNETECIVLSPNFKLIDESQVLLRVPRKNNMYSVDLKNIVPKRGLTCLFAKSTSDESKVWHRRLDHLNFKTMDKLVKGSLVRGLPSKLFENDQTCVACQKGKQHRASSTKDETSGILKSFITGIENLVYHKVKVIRCDNGTEFKNKEMNQFYEKKDHLGKFNGKADEGFFVGYSLNSKAFKVFNSRTRIVEENLHIRFSESTPNAVGSGPDWLFDIDALTRIMNYEPIVAGTQSNGFAGTKASDNAGQARKETEPVKDYILLPLWTADPTFSKIKVVNVVGGKTSIELPFDPNMPALEDVSIFDFSRDDDDVGVEVDINNLDTTIQVSPIPTTRIHKDHTLDQVIGDLKNPNKKVIHALKDPRWIEAMQEELLQFKLQEVWTLVDLPNRKRAIGTKWVFRNKKDKRGIVIRNKARLVAQGYTQRRRGLKYVKKRLYVCQPPGFEDPDFPDRVYKVEKALYGLHQAPRAWYETLSTYLLDNRFQRGKIDKTLFIKRHKGLQVQQKKDGIFIIQDKYVGDILKKFGFVEVKTVSTQIETQKPLLKDENGKEVDVHMYRLMIGSLMYLTSSRPDIMFEVCTSARYQVNLKVSHLHAMKRIFRYLKGQPKLGLWYPKDSPFDLVACTDSDYARASLDRKSTTGGCQFIGSRLISWQCKKQTVVANFTTKAKYLVSSSCCRQVLWIQN